MTRANLVGRTLAGPFGYAATAVIAAVSPARAQTFLVKDVNDTPGGTNNGAPANSIWRLPDGRAIYATRVGLYISDGTPADSTPIVGPNLPTSISRGVVMGAFTYFVDGGVLWRTDGTAAGTARVLTDAGGTIGVSSTAYPFAHEGRLWGFGTVGGATRIWATDGSAAGTWTSPLPISGATGSSYWRLWTDAAAATSKMYVVLTPQFGSDNFELWVCDPVGGAAPTLVEAIPLAYSTGAGPAFGHDGKVFYMRPTDLTTRALWWLDPATNVSTPIPGSAFNPAQLTFMGSVGQHVVYTVQNTFNPPLVRQVWSATTSGATLLVDLVAPSEWLTVGGFVYFNQTSDDIGRFWRTDGTAQGTVAIDVPHAAGVMTRPRAFTAVNGELWFAFDDGLGSGAAWWKTSGTTAGTERLATLPAAPTGGVPVDSSTPRLGIGPRVLFNTTTDPIGEEVWTSDGTQPGTQVLHDLAFATLDSSPVWFTPVNGSLVFSAARAGSNRLFKTDGTRAGTIEIPPPASSGRASLGQSTLFAAPPGVLFNGTAPVGQSGTRLWGSNGTTDGTQALGPAIAAQFSTYGDYHPIAATLDGGITLFPATESPDGLQLWRTDGTPAGTARVTTGAGGFSFGSMGDFARISGSRIVFFASTNAAGYELWTSDGTAASTRLVLNLTSGTGSTFPDAMSPGSGFAIFVEGGRLWRTDGTTAGTFQLLSGTAAFDRVTIGNRMFFAPVSGDRTLRVTDGTVAGTLPITGTTALRLGRLGDRALVATSTGLRISDGTIPGTTVLSSVAPTTRPFPMPTFVTDPLGQFAYYFVDTGAQAGIWRTDGTPEGTTRWRLIAPAIGAETPVPANSNLSSGVDRWFAAFGTRLIFRATTPTRGIEPWAVDIATSTDCDADGVQDQAELATGDAPDVNRDGVIDGCECLADWNTSGSPATVQDIYDFLEDWLAGDADFNHADGTTVQDIYDFLEAWLNACP